MKHINFLITGGSFINKGAEAMALTVKDKIIEKFTNSRIFMRVKPDYFVIAERNGFIPVDSTSPVTLRRRIKSKIETAVNYLRCNVIIDIGGYQFGDPWGVEHAKNTLKRSSLAALFKCKKIYMPQAWGPFKDERFSKYIPAILDASTLYFIRDEISYNSLEKLCPIIKEKLQPDTAWCFDSSDIEVKEILTKYNINPSLKTVCITPNLRVYERYGEVYLDMISTVIQVLLEKKYQVILLGHELRINNEKDDRYLCRKLQSNNPSSIHIDSFLSARQVKQIISYCDFIVSSRYHALIAAFSLNIPAIAIGWSHKYDELLKDVGLPDNLLNPTKLTNQKDINAFFQKKIDELIKQKEILQSSVPDLISRSSRMIGHALDVVNIRL